MKGYKQLGFQVNENDLSGKYVPKESDIIVGVVQNEDNYVYLLDINSHKQGVFFKRNQTAKLYDIYLLRVRTVNEVKDIDIEKGIIVILEFKRSKKSLNWRLLLQLVEYKN